MTRSLRFQVVLFAIIRMVFNTLYRMVYPFLAVFSRGLGVDLAALSIALTNRSLVGMFGAFLATISDRWGRKVGMLFGITLFVIGAGVLAIWPSYPGFMIMLILTTLGKYGFDPAMQAYLGDRVPYERRGMAISVTELGWSLSFFIGIPLTSLLIDRQGWQSPFVWLALAGIAAGTVLVWLIPHDPVPEENPPKRLHNFGQVLHSPLALAALSVGLSATVANEVINLIFGVWMEASFDLKVLALGGTAAAIGVAELIAETLVSVSVDRLGKVRAISIGLIANSLAALAFPLLGETLPGAIVSLFLFFITFEFMLVSSIPMMTEIMPEKRATLMAFNVAGLSLGRAIGALIAPTLFGWGIAASAGAAVFFNLLALGALRKVRRQIA